MKELKQLSALFIVVMLHFYWGMTNNLFAYGSQAQLPETIQVVRTQERDCDDWDDAGGVNPPVQNINFSEYIKDVLPNEWNLQVEVAPGTFEVMPESLKAGAMAVKTFAWSKMVGAGGQRARDYGGDILDCDDDQYYAPERDLGNINAHLACDLINSPENCCENNYTTDCAVDETFNEVMKLVDANVILEIHYLASEADCAPYEHCLPQLSADQMALAGQPYHDILTEYYNSNNDLIFHPEQQFQQNDSIVMIGDGVRTRTEAAGARIRELPRGTVGTLTSQNAVAARFADGEIDYDWWEIRWDINGQEVTGWTADGFYVKQEDLNEVTYATPPPPPPDPNEVPAPDPNAVFEPVDGFVYPILHPDVQNPIDNTVIPFVDWSPDDEENECLEPGENDMWNINQNALGNEFCPGTCGVNSDCYHPGEDWNTCSGVLDDIGARVYSIANGRIHKKGVVPDSGHYLMIEHLLPEPKNLENYRLEGTDAPVNLDVPAMYAISENGIPNEAFRQVERIYSVYMHIDDPAHFSVDDVVRKGDWIGTIAAIGAPHLHFEIRLIGERSTLCGIAIVDPEEENWCGYCPSKQALTDRGHLDPSRLIAGYNANLPPDPVPNPPDEPVEPDPQPDVVEVVRDDCPSFQDVSSNDWHYNYVLRVAYDKVVTGTSPNFFEPDQPVTRAQMVTMLIRAQDPDFPSQCAEESFFNDVEDNHWAKCYIAEAQQRGIIEGYQTVDCTNDPNDPSPQEFFCPGRIVNRAQASKMIVESFPDIQAFYTANQNINDEFIDVSFAQPNPLQPWFYFYVNALVNFTPNGDSLTDPIIQGFAPGAIPEDCQLLDAERRQFCPQSQLTRGQAAKMICLSMHPEGCDLETLPCDLPAPQQ